MLSKKSRNNIEMVQINIWVPKELKQNLIENQVKFIKDTKIDVSLTSFIHYLLKKGME